MTDGARDGSTTSALATIALPSASAPPPTPAPHTPAPASDLAPTVLDPDVELLPDVPIAGPDEDLLGRAAIARRVVELACAQPVAAPRVVALCGGAGTGKTSVLHLVTALLADRTDLACAVVDGAAHASADALLAAVLDHLTAIFASEGVVDTTDAIRDALANHGDVASGIARIAGVKIDVAGALRRSPEAVRAEIAEMTHEVGKRIVVVLDHLDRRPTRELATILDALRVYAAIPHVTLVLALDRRAVTARLVGIGDLEVTGLERLLQVELALPPPDRVLLARLLAGGLARLGARLGLDIDAALHLVDPDARHSDDSPGSPVLDLVETPRDAKRLVNALAAALPLAPPGQDLGDSCLEIALRLLLPELDTPRLDARHRATTPDARAALLAELAALLTGHRRAAAGRAALHALIVAGTGAGR